MELPLELEDAIVCAPDDREGYSVAADFLQQAGAPHGELVALQLADKTNAILDRVIELKRELLWPELRTQAVEWRYGFLRGLAFASMHDGREPALLRDVLLSPLGRFVQKLVVQQAGPRLVEAIVAAATLQPRALRCLRTLMLFMSDDFRNHPVDLAKLSVAVPNLRRLVLRVGWTKNALDLPMLDELVIDGNHNATTVVGSSKLPSLETLHVSNGAFDRASTAWLSPGRMPALRSISLTDDGTLDVDTWQTSPIANQLEQLDLYVIERGIPTERRIVIDRRPRGGSAGLLVMVGHTHDPGEWIPIKQTPFTIGASPTMQLRIYDRHAAPVMAEINRRWVIGRVGARDIYVNGHSIEEAPLRSFDEIAIADHVFRFAEGSDVAPIVAQLRTRYGV